MRGSSFFRESVAAGSPISLPKSHWHWYCTILTMEEFHRRKVLDPFVVLAVVPYFTLVPMELDGPVFVALREMQVYAGP